MTSRYSSVLAGLSLLAANGYAQAPRLVFPAPSADVVVSKDVRYGTSDTVALMMDVYRPPHSPDIPNLIFKQFVKQGMY